MRKTIWLAAVIVAALSFSIVNASSDGTEEYAPVVDAANAKTAFIDGIELHNGKLMVTFDEIEWYEGADADRKFMEEEPDSGLDAAPDGYYIVNDDTATETLELAPDSQVLMQIYDHDGNPDHVQPVWNEQVSAGKLAAIYANNALLDISLYPFHLTVDHGKIVKAVQQYIP